MTAAIRILYVDDEADLLEIGKLFLEESGDFSVTTAQSAPGALRLLEQEKFDTIISDYQMPGMDGIQFLVEVRTRFGQIPFILFTGRGREEVVIQAINSGADFYLQKGGEPGAQFAELSQKIKQAATRKRAEDLLKRSEEKYRHLIEHSDEAIVVAQDGMLRLVNHRAVEITGYSEQELLSRLFVEFIHPDNRAMVMERYQKRLKGEESISRYAFRLSRKDGSTRWVELSVAAMDWDGRPATLNFLTDITDRKRAEEALVESETQKTAILDGITTNIAFVDKDLTILWVNRFGAESVNKSPAEMIGQTCHAMWADPARPCENCPTLRVFETKQSEHTIMHTPDGRVWDERGEPVFDEMGNLIGVVEIAQDITGKKRAEEALLKNTEELNAANEQLTASEEELRQNVDDLGRSERAMRESEEKYRTLVETTGTGFVIIDDMGRVLDANPEYVRLTGHTSRKEITGRNVIEWTAAYEKDKNVEAVSQCMKNGYIRNLEIDYVNASGTIIPVEINASVFRSGNAVQILTLCRDITGRKQVEEALWESEEQYRNIVEDQTEFICRFLPDGTHVFVNDAYCRYFGVAREELLGHRFSPVLYADDRKAVAASFATLTPEKPVGTIDHRIIMPDGTIHWQRWSDRAIFDPGGRVIEYQSVGRDISEYKRSEVALQKSEENYRHLIEHANEAIIVAQDGLLKFVNPMMATMTGYSVEELTTLPYIEIIHPDDRAIVRERRQQRISGEKISSRYMFRINSKDNITRWVEISAVNIDWEGHPATLNFLINITGRKELEQDRDYHEQELRKISESLTAANKKLNLLSSITRHDITNQLTVLTGYLRILEKKQPDTSFSEHFNKINTSAQRVSAMLKFTKEYEKIGITAPSWQDTRILVDIAAKQAPLGKVLVKNDLPAGAEVFADPLVVKVFYNLMDNAVRYGGKITTIRIFAEKYGDKHLIVCEDDGDGVVAGEKEKIFERGFGKNTGLGLFLSREILGITGINIKESGEPGKGARFEIEVPKGMLRFTKNKNG